MGVLQSIKVRQKNFPHRIRYKDFYKRFAQIDVAHLNSSVKEHMEKGSDFKEMSLGIVEIVRADERCEVVLDTRLVLEGKTKYFL